MTVFMESENITHVTMDNDTGADLEQYEFCVVGPFAAQADRAIASGASGSFHVEEGVRVQILKPQDIILLAICLR